MYVDSVVLYITSKTPEGLKRKCQRKCQRKCHICVTTGRSLLSRGDSISVEVRPMYRDVGYDPVVSMLPWQHIDIVEMPIYGDLCMSAQIWICLNMVVRWWLGGCHNCQHTSLTADMAKYGDPVVQSNRSGRYVHIWSCTFAISLTHITITYMEILPVQLCPNMECVV